MTKRPLIWVFLPLFIGVFWVALGSAPAGASVLYSTDFENFIVGELNGQQGWTTYGNNAWRIQTNYSHSGIKAARPTGEVGVGWWALSPAVEYTSEGYVEFWFNELEVLGGADRPIRIYTTNGPVMLLEICHTSACYGKEMKIVLESIYSGPIVCSWTPNTWIKIGIEWQTDRYRARCDDGTPTDWINKDIGTAGRVEIWGLGPGDTTGIFDDVKVATGSLPPPPVYSISISRPVNESIIPDFDNWLFNYEFYNGSAATTSLAIATRIFPTASTTTPAWWYDEYAVWDIPGDSTTTRVFEMAKANPLWAGKTYWADARLFILNGDLLATSNLISFTISTSSVGIFEGIPVATTTELVITCDPSDPFFQYSLCKLAAWLFVPSPTILNRFADLKTAVQNKPPIGYFTAAKDVLATLKNGTPTTEFAVLTGITDPIKDGLTWLFWFVFLFWLFNRIRHLDI